MAWKRFLKWLQSSRKADFPQYEIVDRGETVLSSFKITEGEFVGTEFLIGKVSLPSENDNCLDYTVQYLNVPSGICEELLTEAINGIVYNHLTTQLSDSDNWLYMKK